jgi:hypothetical protein
MAEGDVEFGERFLEHLRIFSTTAALRGQILTGLMEEFAKLQNVEGGREVVEGRLTRDRRVWERIR